MAPNAALSIENAWNSVALEERLELISRANAEGIIAAIVFTTLVGAAAYGFDQITLLGGGALASLLLIPLFASYCWRRNKPELILKYLATRSMARRYALAHHISDFEILLIFRGELSEEFSSAQAEAMSLHHRTVEFDTPLPGRKEVWIVLMRGGVVVLSERPGGAKVEFLSPTHHDLECSAREDNHGSREILLGGSGFERGRTVLLRSRHQAALYVLETQIKKLVENSRALREKLIESPPGREARIGP